MRPRLPRLSDSFSTKSISLQIRQIVCCFLAQCVNGFLSLRARISSCRVVSRSLGGRVQGLQRTWRECFSTRCPFRPDCGCGAIQWPHIPPNFTDVFSHKCESTHQRVGNRLQDLFHTAVMWREDRSLAAASFQETQLRFLLLFLPNTLDNILIFKSPLYC